MGFLDKLFGYKNPADKAMPYLNRIPQEAGQYLKPYQQQGLNPSQTQNQWGSGFQQSPGYDFAMQQAMNAGNQAAAAGGMAGSPQHQQYSQEMASNFANQDYNNYQNRNMGISQMGMGAGQGLSDLIAQTLAQQGQLSYAGRQNKNMANAGNVRFLGQLAGSNSFGNYGLSGDQQRNNGGTDDMIKKFLMQMVMGG